MNLEQIKNLYKKYKTPHHVKQHMKEVSRVALFLAKKLKKNSLQVNISFTRNLSLLHDFLKMLVFKERKNDDPKIWNNLRKKYPGMHDAEVASLILDAMNEHKLAKSIRTQQFDAIISKKHPIETLEEKLVYYADKRVAHTKIVSLPERFREGNKRYPAKKDEEKTVRLIQKKIYELEKQLCKQARIKPGSVKQHFLKEV